MQISSFAQSLGSLFGSSSVSAPGQGAAAGGAQSNRPELAAARRQLLGVLDAFAAVDRLINGRSTVLTGLPSARSDPALALNLSETAAALSSTQEVNATPTSFSPFAPAWANPSLAQLTIGGIYDGSNGTGALTFESRNAGVHGEDRLRIRVRDAQDNIIKNITIRDNHALDREYDIGNGLFLTLGAGSLERNISTTIQVYDDVGSVVDPDKPLNGTGNDNPNLQYGLADIVDGSFDLNGETIAVSAGGSLNDVVDAINQSNAGVTATFNALTERIDLVQNTTGSASSIVIANDSSNFVVATKLDSAVVTPGTDNDVNRALTSVDQFAGVQSGSFTVNGTSIALDAATDSLSDVIERINTSGAEVTASFDTQTQKVVITGDSSGDPLTIDGNGTGIFDALNMPEGRVDPRARGRGFSRRQAGQIVRAIDDAMTLVNEFLRDTSGPRATDPTIASLRGQLKNAFASSFNSPSGTIDTGYGLRFNFDGVGKQYLRFATVDGGALSSRLQSRSADIKQLFNGNSQTGGLLQAVSTATEGAISSLNATLGLKGARIDTFA